jgi:hypothetical protein
VEESLDTWRRASQTFALEWRSAEKPTGRGSPAKLKEYQAIQAHNRALLAALKRAKREHQRWAEFAALWEEMRSQEGADR